jgi:hypothetical protein
MSQRLGLERNFQEVFAASKVPQKLNGGQRRLIGEQSDYCGQFPRVAIPGTRRRGDCKRGYGRYEDTH